MDPAMSPTYMQHTCTTVPQRGLCLMRRSLAMGWDARTQAGAARGWCDGGTALARGGAGHVTPTAHAKSGTTPLPCTNVDRWAVLGGRGLHAHFSRLDHPNALDLRCWLSSCCARAPVAPNIWPTPQGWA